MEADPNSDRAKNLVKFIKHTLLDLEFEQDARPLLDYVSIVFNTPETPELAIEQDPYHKLTHESFIQLKQEYIKLSCYGCLYIFDRTEEELHPFANKYCRLIYVLADYICKNITNFSQVLAYITDISTIKDDYPAALFKGDCTNHIISIYTDYKQVVSNMQVYYLFDNMCKSWLQIKEIFPEQFGGEQLSKAYEVISKIYLELASLELSSTIDNEEDFHLKFAETCKVFFKRQQELHALTL